jgi:C4-dicarboxylate transporter, DctM subunit
MTPLEIGYFGVLALIILIIIRVPVAIALILPSLVGVWAIIGTNAAWGLLRSTPYEIGGNWSLSSIPMFLLMGYICYHARLTDGLFKAARCWLSALPGGLGISTIAGAAVFSAVSGSTTACAAAMGRIAVPEMLKERYNPGFAASICAVGGTLGSMIPPSIVMIIYGTFAEVPIGQLFIAGVLPGLLSAIVFSLVIIAVAWLRPDICPPGNSRIGWADRIASLGETWPVMLLITGVLGGIFTGTFSATEAGAVGAFFSLVIATLRRTMTPTILATALVETARMTATILIIAIGAALFTRFLALSGVATHFSELAILYATSPLLLVLGVAVVYLVLGMFLDPLGIMLLTLPLLLPAFNALDIDLIWMGILVVKFLEIGLITPPVGLNLFVMQAIVGREASIDRIARFLVWFILADLCTMGLLIAFPAIVSYLPSLLG